jgi:DNA repair protein RadC
VKSTPKLFSFQGIPALRGGGIMENKDKITWEHPGGKLRRMGPASLSDAELIAVILGSGIHGKPAEKIADEIIERYYSLPGLMGKTIAELMKIKGLKEVKATQLAAVFEVARRIVKSLEKE